MQLRKIIKNRKGELSPFSAMLFLFFFEMFTIMLITGLVPNNPFLITLMTNPPSYSGSWWDFGFYIASVLLWAISKALAIFGLLFYAMFFSGIWIITMSQIFIIGLLLIIFIFYIRGTK